MSAFKPNNKYYGFLFPAGASLLLLLIMGFIDEKHYNFDFLFDTGSLKTLGIYLAALLIADSLFYFFLLRNFQWVNRAIYSFILGIPLAIMILALSVMLLID